MKLFLAALFSTLLTFNASAMIVGKVDIQRILLTIKEGQSIKDKLKKEFDKKQDELKKEETAIRKLQEDFQKQAVVMNDKAKGQKEREIQQKVMGLQQKSMQYQKEMQKLEQTQKGPILEKIKVVVDAISKDAGVDITFEISTAPVVYAKNSKDLTDQVIAAYDKKHKK